MASKPDLGDLAAAGLSNVGIGPLSIGSMLDTVEFVKKAWTSFGVPSSLAPTTDLGEIDRRIADLKAVEQWLTVNLNMLQGTIQAIEVQRATIATLKAYADAVGESASAVPGAQALADALAAAAPMFAAAGTGAAAGSPAAAPRTPGGEPADAGDREREASFGTPRERVGERDAAAARSGARTAGKTPADKSGDTTVRAFEAPSLDPAAWWHLLQGQFNQIASTAMSGVGLSPVPATPEGRTKTSTKAVAREPGSRSRRGAPVARTDASDAPARGGSASHAPVKGTGSVKRTAMRRGTKG